MFDEDKFKKVRLLHQQIIADDGYDSRLDKAIEEILELGKAIGDYKKKTSRENAMELLREVIDVQIMLPSIVMALANLSGVTEEDFLRTFNVQIGRFEKAVPKGEDKLH